MEKREASAEFDDIARRIIILSSILYLTVIVSMSILTDTVISLVFLGTAPFLLYQVAFFILYIYHHEKNPTVWIMPLFFPLVFLLIWSSKAFSVITGMEGPVVVVLNILFSYAANGIYFLFMKHERKEKKQEMKHEDKKIQAASEHYHQWAKYYHDKAAYHMQEADLLKRQLDNYKEALQITQKNFTVKLRGIEDKCKAINFVIGRVYSDKNGGSEKIRAKLKIDSALYNSFSEITSHFKEDDAKKLLDVLTKIYLKLTTLELPESKVLGKKIQIKMDGDQKIIDILNSMDKDPVFEYHTEAKEVCTNLMNYIKQTYKLH